MIRFSHVYKSYPNGALALKDVSFRVGKGEFVFLTGHSGAGKSTIMKMLYAEQQPTSPASASCGRPTAPRCGGGWA